MGKSDTTKKAVKAETKQSSEPSLNFQEKADIFNALVDYAVTKRQLPPESMASTAISAEEFLPFLRAQNASWNDVTSQQLSDKTNKKMRATMNFKNQAKAAYKDLTPAIIALQRKRHND
jgi:hypothetical protein